MVLITEVGYKLYILTSKLAILAMQVAILGYKNIYSAILRQIMKLFPYRLRK